MNPVFGYPPPPTPPTSTMKTPLEEHTFITGRLWDLLDDHAKVITRQFTRNTSVKKQSTLNSSNVVEDHVIAAFKHGLFILFFTLGHNSCPRVYISAASHLIKHQIWTWLFVWLRFCVLSGHTDAGQRPAHFASRLRSHRRPICLCGGNFMVKVRTRSFFFFFCFWKAGKLLVISIPIQRGESIQTKPNHTASTVWDWFLFCSSNHQRKHRLFYKILSIGCRETSILC